MKKAKKVRSLSPPGGAPRRIGAVAYDERSKKSGRAVVYESEDARRAVEDTNEETSDAKAEPRRRPL